MEALGATLTKEELVALQEKQSGDLTPQTYVYQGDTKPLKIEPGLPMYKQPRFLRGVFTIILTSVIMSTFELVFFYVVAKPQATRQLENYLDTVLLEPEVKAPATPDGLPSTEILYESALNRMVEEQNKNMERNNTLRGVGFAFFICFLIALLFFIDRKLHQEAKKIHYARIFGGEMNISILTAVLSAFILVTFQVNFYMFGQKFNYIGSEGKEEFLLMLTNSIRESTGMTKI